MITVLLIGFAVYLVAGQQIGDRLRTAYATATLPSIDARHVAAAVVAVAAVISLLPRSLTDPTPAPPHPNSFTLRGKFVGPSAAADAATVSALCDELAACIEWDGMNEQRLKTGVAFDDLRIAAREARCKGDSIGARQPQVRDAIHKFLDDAVGSSGGPVTPESRAAWVVALRDLARAAADVTR